MMTFAARKEPDIGVIQESRRFIPPDFDRVGIWLIDRLGKKFTHLDQRQILSWLRGVMESSSYLFITNDAAVLLARMSPKDMDTAPKVDEVFCLCRGDNYRAGGALYADLARWAKSLGASQVTVMNFTDVTKSIIEEFAGAEVASRKGYFLSVQ